MDVFVARQAILDRSRRLYGYELLFRSDGIRNEFNGIEAGAATSQVIATSLLTIGFENLLGGKKAFINFGRRSLLEESHLILPNDKTVIEILETIEPDEDVLQACRNLKAQGYVIALDDFVRDPRYQPLVDLADLIKVDMRTTPREEQERLVRAFKPKRIAMLAEKVETHEEFDWAHRIGFDYFQGYFFARPLVVCGRQIPASTITCMRLLQEMQQTDLDFKHLENLICEDVSLAYKLLRYVNSALLQRRGEVHSIGRALMVLGEAGIRRWVTFATLPLMAKDKPSELVTHSLVRARFCECVAQLAGIAGHNLAFLMGLFSLLDALIDRPLEEALKHVKLAPAITAALLGTAEGSAFTRVYKLVRHYEAGDWDIVDAAAGELGIKTASIYEAYVDSTTWAAQVLNAAPEEAIH